MAVLVTGAAGFIGCNLSKSLVAQGKKVVGFDNLSLGRLSNLEDLLGSPSFSFTEVDLFELGPYRDALARAAAIEPITEIWHLVANSDIPSGVEDSRVDFRDTFMTTFHTLELMKEYGIGVIAFASSSAIYGNHGDSTLVEDTGPLFPISNYGAMKLASEAAISAAVESFLDKAYIFRFPNVIGIPATHGVILDFIRKLKATPDNLVVLGDGTQQKSYLHVEDLVEAMLYIRERAGERLNYFNVGGDDDGVTVRFIAEQVVAEVSPSAAIQYGSGNKGWVGDVPKFSYSVDKLRNLGWRPGLNSADAICRAIRQIAVQERRMKQAVILAGGKGTRLRERLGDLPKPLIDICGKPLLERQIELVKRHGYTHVLLLVSYASQYIIDFCAGSVDKWGLSIECIEDGQPLGTAGAVLAQKGRLEEDFLVMYGDTMMEIDLARFHAFHRSRPDVAATLFLHPNDHPNDSDLVELDDEGRIAAFHPYPHDPEQYYPNLVNAALYYVRRTALEPWRHTQGPLDFGKHIFPAMLERGQILLGYNSPEYIKDCGTPERLDRVCADFTSGRVARASLSVAQRGVFIDRDGTINRETGHLSRHEQFELLPGVEEAIKLLNGSQYRTIVVTNQPVLARGECSFAGLKQIHNKMDTLLGRSGAYVDRTYYCPHHPDRGFEGEVPELKIDCNCRKPATGMIEQAREDLNIDIAHSWMVGDTSVDVLMARRAGLHSIVVQTGYAGLDGRHGVTPDFTVPDLNVAAHLILDDYPRLLAMCEGLGAGIAPGDFVFVGGLSRSGKSTLAACLKDALENSGRKAVIFSLDRWLLNEGERKESVLGRYGLGEVHPLLAGLARRTGAVTVKAPLYDKIRRRRRDDMEFLEIGHRDVVIVDGTIALSLLDAVPAEISHAWFVEADEEERRLRVLREYELRGFIADEAEAVYRTRQEDETPIILAGAGSATQRIALHLGPSHVSDIPHLKEHCR